MKIFVTDWVENNVGKGENAGYQHFLLFPQCLQKAAFPGSLKARVENTVGKGENAGYQHFLLFPQCFQKASIQGSLTVRIVWQS